MDGAQRRMMEIKNRKTRTGYNDTHRGHAPDLGFIVEVSKLLVDAACGGKCVRDARRVAAKREERRLEHAAV